MNADASGNASMAVCAPKGSIDRRVDPCLLTKAQLGAHSVFPAKHVKQNRSSRASRTAEGARPRDDASAEAGAPTH